MKTFSEMGLKPELVTALTRLKYINATDVQERAIPVAIEGKDVIVRAKTGTGKTCAFLVPILQNAVRAEDPAALIIVPTRELAIQIAEVATKLANDRTSVVTVYGASSMNVQVDGLRHSPLIVVGTPGRLLDLIERGALRLDNAKYVVLDEADTMLDMGFLDDIERIISYAPSTRQTMLFSATMPDRILEVAKEHMNEPSYILVGAEEEIVATGISHYYAVCDSRMKFATLVAYIKEAAPTKAIIFAETKYAADEIHAALTKLGVEALLMHGNITQKSREASIKSFKSGHSRFLIATNIAARGLDIKEVSDIINFDLPDDPYIYVHRVGRTARMDANGKAFSIVRKDQLNLIEGIEYVTNIKMSKLQLDTRNFRSLTIFKPRGRPRNMKGVKKHSFSATRFRGSVYGRYNPAWH